MSTQVRPIDAEATYQAMVKTIVAMMRTKRWMRSDKDNEDEILLVIQNAPTLDYAPVRHSQWLYRMYSDTERATIDGELCCPECSHRFKRIKGTWFKHCPECGVKMDGGKNDG